MIPIPSEVTMPFAGAMAATGHLNLLAVILLGAFGNLLGSYIAWGIGRTGGRLLVERFGSWVLLKKEDLDRSERWFRRFGEPTVFFSRILPVVRTFISLPAGMAEMEPIRFGVYTLLGSFLWSGALAIGGYEVGSNWHAIANVFGQVTDIVAVIVVLLLIGFLYMRFKSKREQGKSSQVGDSSSHLDGI